MLRIKFLLAQVGKTKTASEKGHEKAKEITEKVMNCLPFSPCEMNLNQGAINVECRMPTDNHDRNDRWTMGMKRRKTRLLI